MPKKQTYIKKTDIKGDKPWLKKTKPSKYKIETEDKNRTILIVCEGQTEELYFKSFPVITLKVEAVELGQTKLKLVDTALKLSEQKTYDEIWCVFDLDIKRDEENCIPDFDNAISKALNLGFKVANSNDAFELWFYLHYQYTDQENHRTFYYQKLSELWNLNYEKEGKKWDYCYKNYKRLNEDTRASQEKAIERAKNLYELKKELPFHMQNPVSLVFELVELLNENMKK